MGSLANPPTLVEHSGWRFLIMDAPSDANLHLYIHVCREKLCGVFSEKTHTLRVIDVIIIMLILYSFFIIIILACVFLKYCRS